MWLVLFWRDILLQYFLVSITLGVNCFTGVSHFALEGILAVTIPQLWIVLDCKSTLSCFDLRVSHNGRRFFHNYKQLWIWSLHFRSWVWWFHTNGVNVFTTMNTLNWILYFCTWILRFHTWHVNFFTTINNSRIEVCIFEVGFEDYALWSLSVSHLGEYIKFSHLWVLLISINCRSWVIHRFYFQFAQLTNPNIYIFF